MIVRTAILCSCCLLLPLHVLAEDYAVPEEGDSDAALRWLGGAQIDSRETLPPSRLISTVEPRRLKRTHAEGAGPILTTPRRLARDSATRAVGTDSQPTRVVRRAKHEGNTASSKPKAQGHFVFRWPLRKVRVTSRYGMRRDPKKRKRRKMHKGTDFAGRRGTHVLATGPGTVLYAGRGGGGVGICVVIRHPDGWVSRYFHLSKTSVRSGQAVKRGQKIGGIGSTGRSTGPHLHFQLERHGKLRNPEKVVGRRSDKVR
jgi:murein DD-endopeptidase MepM/ murein hydrolase activator NlpD